MSAAGRRQQLLGPAAGLLLQQVLQLLPSLGQARADVPLTRLEINTSLAPDQSRYGKRPRSVRASSVAARQALTLRALQMPQTRASETRRRCFRRLLTRPTSRCARALLLSSSEHLQLASPGLPGAEAIPGPSSMRWSAELYWHLQPALKPPSRLTKLTPCSCRRRRPCSRSS